MPRRKGGEEKQKGGYKGGKETSDLSRMRSTLGHQAGRDREDKVGVAVRLMGKVLDDSMHKNRHEDCGESERKGGGAAAEDSQDKTAHLSSLPDEGEKKEKTVAGMVVDGSTS